MKQIMFSKVFPAHHILKGEPTNFVEKILSAEKKHTIRAGKRWKLGEQFNPKVWSELPYRSTTINFHETQTIKSLYDIDYYGNDKYNNGIWRINGKLIDLPKTIDLAYNDGLSLVNFKSWFSKTQLFSGQIIGWHDDINY